MGKGITSSIAVMLSAILLYAYLLPYDMPFAFAEPISNGSAIINGTINGIPGGVSVVLFIVNQNNDQFTPVMGLSSSHNTFSQEVSASEGDIFGFKINGKDTGTTVTYHGGTVINVALQYTSPDGPVITIVPITPTPTVTAAPTATPTPTPVVTATPTITPTPLPSPGPISTVSPSPAAASPATTVASPSPAASATAASSVNPAIYAILLGVVMLASLVVVMRRF